MRGVIVAFFPEGHGFLKPMADPTDRWSTGDKAFFFHMKDSPNMPDVIQSWQEVVGKIVDFDLAPDWGERTKAINLTPVE